MQCINTGYSCVLPSLQSLQISSLSVYTLMLYGSIASTLTFRFFKYLSSILYGCLAPLVRSNVITTTGPLEVSGFAAGVSVEGPIASVSAQVRVAGAEGLEGVDCDIDSEVGGFDCACDACCGCDCGRSGCCSEGGLEAEAAAGADSVMVDP